MKLGRRLNRRCRECGDYEVYECGYSHRGIFGALNCSQCKNRGELCASAKHPRRKEAWQC